MSPKESAAEEAATANHDAMSEDMTNVASAPPDDATVAAEITRLSKLKPIVYERERKAAAERIGIDRISILDKLVKAEQHEDSDDTGGQGRRLELPEPEPWDHPVNGAELLSAIAAEIRSYMVMESGAAEIVALWTLHSHALDAFGMSPRLAITSPRPGCGKTTLLDVLNHLTPRPLFTASLKAPTLFRTIEAAHPTLLIDEMDTFLAGDEELRGIINDGHRRNGRAIRLVGDDNEPRQFSTWAAMAVAKIGEFPETISDRSVKIKLKRKRPDETVKDFRFDRTEALDVLASKAARWSADHVRHLADMDPAVPSNLHNRASDNWRPLLAIADAAGGEWPKIGRDIATGTVDPEQSTRTKLLADIRDVFTASGHAQLPSANIVLALIAMEGRPWAEWHHGKAITVNGLARLLATDGVSPATIRFEGSTPKGYKLAQFADAFARYLPNTPNQTATPPQPAENKGFQGNGKAQQANGCGGSENPGNPSVSAPCGVVAFQKGVEPESDAKLPWGTEI